jgi:hypothetical protein
MAMVVMLVSFCEGAKYNFSEEYKGLGGMCYFQLLLLPQRWR